MAMAESHAKHHDYHLVDPSPWPAVGAVGAFVLAVGAIMFFISKKQGDAARLVHLSRRGARPLHHDRVVERRHQRGP